MDQPPDAPVSHNTLAESLGGRAVALVGLMGSGKTTVGRRLAGALGLPFKDADAEIEQAAGRSVSDIFAELGEPEFRAGEHRVIARLLAGGPMVLATGGGAYIDAKTRALLREKAVTVWLKADIEVLARRVARRDTRPLLRGKDPAAVLEAQAEKRNPIYAEADIVVVTPDSAHDSVVERILGALKAYLA
jgi:shikimate kinase